MRDGQGRQLAQMNKSNVAFAIDSLFRILTASSMSFFIYRIGRSYLLDTSRITTLLFLTSEVITLAFVILSRRPTFRDSNPAYAALTIFATFVVPLFTLAVQDAALVSEVVASSIAIIGVLWTIYAKLSLGRSFGLVAAHRAIKVEGAYRYVRHPLYIGYLVIDFAFLLRNFTLSNCVVIVGFCLAQVLRALREERTLMADPTYRDYCGKVKYRFIYGVF